MKALASFRRGMELFANIRPAKVYPQLIQASPLKDTVARELDLIVLRENTAGIFYAGKYRKEIGGELTACDECVYTWSQIERHARCAFDLAMGRKKHVTMVNKPNAMETGVLWQTVYEKVAEEYPEVHYETMLIDGCAARLASRPGDFDVIAAENMFAISCPTWPTVPPAPWVLPAPATLGARARDYTSAPAAQRRTLPARTLPIPLPRSSLRH